MFRVRLIHECGLYTSIYGIKRKCGLSLNHKAETLFAKETFVKKAAFGLYENKTRAESDPPKRKSKKRKISGS